MARDGPLVLKFLPLNFEIVSDFGIRVSGFGFRIFHRFHPSAMQSRTGPASQRSRRNTNADHRPRKGLVQTPAKSQRRENWALGQRRLAPRRERIAALL